MLTVAPVAIIAGLTLVLFGEWGHGLALLVVAAMILVAIFVPVAEPDLTPKPKRIQVNDWPGANRPVVTVEVAITKRFHLRLWLSLQLMKIAIWLAKFDAEYEERK